MTCRSRLSSLPGELRNKIYEYCVEDDIIPLRRRPNEQHSAGAYRSLTQTNRQIRDEFRPMYMKHTAISISLSPDNSNYIDTFLIRPSKGIQKPYHGDLTIKVPDEIHFQRYNFFCLLLALTGSPALLFRFELTLLASQLYSNRPYHPYHVYGCIDWINRFLRNFAFASDLNWRYMMLEAVGAVGVTVVSHYPQSHMKLYLHPHMVTKWKPVLKQFWIFIGQRDFHSSLCFRTGLRTVMKTAAMLRVRRRNAAGQYVYMSVSGCYA
ncbi:hypothetical protein IAQ61_003286 [Plenodomus lingam]|uniref:Predicted protein n=1 Tax=Leptosphaeria maculans (strain JN3 / isolate v23.1.3 / race Av1-4-5-6-7-8) TaxID=985895 RepID=E5AE19_LEPMJ|nr:predicted protein [Plenodomus lingam JN3]KAH9875821.1 hypothetical protein IAQ61_003286 [Plenodomus lingam]CBY01458.1 predicted protein [Plenodomus lingam JN3]